MEARYFTDESGERVGVVLNVAEYEHLRRFTEEAAKTTRHPGAGAAGPLEYWRGRYPNLNIQSIEY